MRFSPICWSSQVDNFRNCFLGKNPRQTRPYLRLQTQGGDSGEPCNLVEGMKKSAYRFFEYLFLKDGLLHPCFTRQLKPTSRPVLLADMAMGNEWYVKVAIAFYYKCSQLDHVNIWQFGLFGNLATTPGAFRRCNLFWSTLQSAF